MPSLSFPESWWLGAISSPRRRPEWEQGISSRIAGIGDAESFTLAHHDHDQPDFLENTERQGLLVATDHESWQNEDIAEFCDSSESSLWDGKLTSGHNGLSRDSRSLGVPSTRRGTWSVGHRIAHQVQCRLAPGTVGRLVLQSALAISVLVVAFVSSGGSGGFRTLQGTQNWASAAMQSAVGLQSRVWSARNRWETFGTHTACRLDGADLSNNGMGTVLLRRGVLSLLECKELCEAEPRCRAVEFSRSRHRCELWTEEVGSTKTTKGYECLIRVNEQEGNQTSHARFHAWITRVDPNGMASEILAPQAHLVDYMGNASEVRVLTLSPTDSFPPINTIPQVKADSVLGDSSDLLHVQVHTEHGLQKMVGFGAGLPHASAHVLQSLKIQNYGLYREVMHRFFHTGDGSAGITMVRFPIGSSEFSLQEETYDDVAQMPGCTSKRRCPASCSIPGGACSIVQQVGDRRGQAQNCSLAPSCGFECTSCQECRNCCCLAADWSLSQFGPYHDDIIATLQHAKSINPAIVLMGTPWSAPAWLKTEGTVRARSHNNSLLDIDDAYETYAKYLARVIQSFRSSGLRIDYLTLQNEPLYDGSDSPGMFLTSHQYARLGRAVRAQLGEVPKLLAFDHNWDHDEYPIQAISAAPGVFSGTAWHCYGGKMDVAQEKIHEMHPSLETHVTECTGSYPEKTCNISKGMEGFGWNHEWDMRNVLLGATSHWAQSSMKWPLVLDESCGPMLPQATFRWGRPLVSIPSNTTDIRDIRFNQDFWSVAHMARFVRPGAQRVKTDVDNSDSNSIIETFRDDAAGTVTLLAVNLDHSNVLPLVVADKSLRFKFVVPKWGTAVLVWKLTDDSTSR